MRPSDPADPADPAYRWSVFDREVQLARKYELEPLLLVNATPAWARNHVTPRSNVPRLDELRAFAHAAVRRYNGATPGIPRVRYWQVWNEPNVGRYLQPQDVGGRPYAAPQYRVMVNTFGAEAHAVSGNYVIAGGLSPFTVRLPTLRAIGPMRFMRDMLCMSRAVPARQTCGGRAHFDIWAHHPYTSGGPTHHAANPNDVSLGDLGKMKRLLDAAVRARHVLSIRGVRFWVTEFSWDTNPPDRHALPVGLQARWTSEALYRMWSVGIDLVTWNQLRDDPYPAEPVQSGLYFRGRDLAHDRPKPTLTAFRFPFVAYRRAREVSVWGRTPGSAAGRIVVEGQARGGWRRLAVIATNRNGIFRGSVHQGSERYVRARLISSVDRSLPFSLAAPPDRFVYPFG